MKSLLIIFFAITISASTGFTQTDDWQSLQKIFGNKGSVNGDIIKFTFPRSDLNVKFNSVKIEPALALTSWVAFSKMDDNVMAMGDLVLLEHEALIVVPKLIGEGIHISAIHNHLLNEKPKIMYVHISASGKANDVAEKIKNILKLTGTPIPNKSMPKPSDYDWSKVESIMGFKGSANGDVISFGIPRNETIKENGTTIPPFMGVATGINFQHTGNKAYSTGDFVLLAGEVEPVEDALTKSGIIMTALHTHMLFETPKLYFMHFWGAGDPDKLAAALKEALSKTNSHTK